MSPEYTPNGEAMQRLPLMRSVVTEPFPISEIAVPVVRAMEEARGGPLTDVVVDGVPMPVGSLITNWMMNTDNPDIVDYFTQAGTTVDEVRATDLYQEYLRPTDPFWPDYCGGEQGGTQCAFDPGIPLIVVGNGNDSSVVGSTVPTPAKRGECMTLSRLETLCARPEDGGFGFRDVRFYFFPGEPASTSQGQGHVFTMCHLLSVLYGVIPDQARAFCTEVDLNENHCDLVRD